MTDKIAHLFSVNENPMNGRWCPVKGDTEDGLTASYKKVS